MIQLSYQVVTLIGVKLDGFPEGTANDEIVLNFTNQYTQEVFVYAPVPITTVTTGRATKMFIYPEYPVGTYIIDFLNTKDDILATQLAYISGTDVIGEDDFKAYTVGDSDADVVYPNT